MDRPELIEDDSQRLMVLLSNDLAELKSNKPIKVLTRRRLIKLVEKALLKGKDFFDT